MSVRKGITFQPHKHNFSAYAWLTKISKHAYEKFVSWCKNLKRYTG